MNTIFSVYFFQITVVFDNLRRLDEHNEGTNSDAFTFNRRPFELVYWQEFSDYNQAIDWETQLKKWSRKKKEALINEDWERVKKLAVCNNETSHTNKK